MAVIRVVPPVGDGGPEDLPVDAAEQEGEYYWRKHRREGRTLTRGAVSHRGGFDTQDRHPSGLVYGKTTSREYASQKALPDHQAVRRLIKRRRRRTGPASGAAGSRLSAAAP